MHFVNKQKYLPLKHLCFTQNNIKLIGFFFSFLYDNMVTQQIWYKR